MRELTKEELRVVVPSLVIEELPPSLLLDAETQVEIEVQVTYTIQLGNIHYPEFQQLREKAVARKREKEELQAAIEAHEAQLAALRRRLKGE